MSLKAIETRYKGYRFRSRTEARWAVFFDGLGLSWEYEKEGYEFDGIRYLPDFWLPQLRMFIEVKGDMPTGEEADRVHKFAVQHHFETGEFGRVLVAIGNPSRDGVMADAHSAPEHWWLAKEAWLEDRRDEGIFWLSSDVGTHCIGGWGKATDHDKWPIWSARMQKALEASRAARFEHGERG